MDEVSLKFLNLINVPFIKIGSGDFHNKLLLKAAADLKKPLIISTGMAEQKEVSNIYNYIKKIHNHFCFLHCVSSYPAPCKEINLNVLSTYKELFPDINIGYSGHELGINISIAAVMLGAKIIERHFTLDKSWKGSDHICSLTANEFKEMVLSIRSFESKKSNIDAVFNKRCVQESLGGYEKKFQPSEMACYEKLGKTIVAAINLKAGDLITEKNIAIKVAEPKGIPGKLFDSIINKTVKRNIQEDESIFESDLL